MGDYNLEVGVDFGGLNSDLSKATDSMDAFVTSSKKAGKEVDDTLNKQKKGADEAVKSQKKLTKEVKKEAKSIDELEKQLKTLKKARAQTHDTVRIKKYNAEIEKTDKKLKDLTKNTEKSGKGLGGLFGGLGKSISSMISPIAILSAGVVGLAGGYLKASNEIRKLETITKNLFGSDADISGIVSKTRELANVYDQDVNELLKTANVLSKEFGESGVNSLSLIEEGIRRGADLNGDFLDQLKEYSSQFVSIGLNAEESIAIITQTANRGVFSDKGVDLIKEAGIRLREMPQATKDALKAIGLNSTELQKSIQDGTKTTFEVIQEVSNKTKEFGDNAQETGVVLADVFGGAGEDAGKFVLELGSVKTDLDDIADNTSDLENEQQRLTKSWTGFIDAVFAGDSVTGQFFTNLLSNISTAIEGLTEFISTAEANSQRRMTEFAKESNEIVSDYSKTLSEFENASTEELEKRIAMVKKQNEELKTRIYSTEDTDIQKELNDKRIKLIQQGRALNQLKDLGNEKNKLAKILVEESVKAQSELNKEQKDLNSELEKTKKLKAEVNFLEELLGTEDQQALERSKSTQKISEENVTFQKALLETSEKDLQNILKKSNADQLKELKGLNNDKLNELIGFEEKRRANAERQALKAKQGIVAGGTASREAERLAQEKAKLESEFLRMLQKLTDDTQKAVTDGLEGEAKINAILKNSIADINEQQTVLLQLNEKVGKDVAENKKKIITDTATLILEAEEKANEAIDRLREKEESQFVNEQLGEFSEGGEIEQLKTELSLKQALGESEIEFEKRKANAILEIQKSVAQEKINFLLATGEDENSLRVLQLKKLVSDIEGKLNIGLEEAVQKSLAQQFDDSLKNLFGINDEELGQFKSSVSDLANTLIESYSSMIQGQIDEKTRLIDSYEENISDIESQLDREISKNQEGNASNIKGLEEKLAREKELQAQAEKDREALMEKERKFRKAIATAELIQNTALQISNLALAVSRTAGETGTGAFVVVPALIGLLATVIGGVASIASQPDTSGFFEGGFTGGNTTTEERGVVHGKEFVHTADKTAKYRTLFEGIHTDNKSLISQGLNDLLNGTGVELLKDAPERLSFKQTALNQGSKNDKSEKYLKSIEENTKRQTEKKEERYTDSKGREVVVRGNTKITYE